MAIGYAPKLPLERSPEDGGYALLKNIRSVTQQNLKMLILTAPGERIMDPNYGVGLRRYLFEQDTLNLTEKLQNIILSQASKYMPHIEIKVIMFRTADETNDIPENSMQVRIKFTIPAIKEIAFIDIDITSRNII